MKQSLQLRLGQSLTMTPQLQQAIRLLQLSTLELHAEIQQALESNMMLEVEEDLDEAPPNGVDRGDGAAAESAGGAEGEIPPEPTSMPDELPVDSDWEDVYEPALPSAPSGGDAPARDYDASASEPDSLRAHLMWQLDMMPLSELDRAIATAIVDMIGDDGYLEGTIEDVLQAMGDDTGVEEDEVEAVLHQIQHLDPVGVGARDLRECLLLQLGQLAPETPWLEQARALVAEHLDLLGAHDYNGLVKRMKLSSEDLQQVITLIQAMNPRPGGQISSAQPEYIIPDVFVRKVKGVWKVELNPDSAPRIRINPEYARLVRRSDTSDTNVSMKNHLQEARWFLKSLQSRSETLLKVARGIVERQRNFLEFGEEAMKPLVLHDIAEAVDMHESTISRVTTRKYMHTPRGIYELKYFFSSHVGTDHGGECSSTAIRALIRKLIAAENPLKPLSDSKITVLLADQGINVARRTVAKYRESMGVPPSNERKRIA